MDDVSIRSTGALTLDPPSTTTGTADAPPGGHRRSGATAAQPVTVRIRRGAGGRAGVSRHTSPAAGLDRRAGRPGAGRTAPAGTGSDADRRVERRHPGHVPDRPVLRCWRCRLLPPRPRGQVFQQAAFPGQRHQQPGQRLRLGGGPAVQLRAAAAGAAMACRGLGIGGGPRRPAAAEPARATTAPKAAASAPAKRRPAPARTGPGSRMPPQHTDGRLARERPWWRGHRPLRRMPPPAEEAPADEAALETSGPGSAGPARQVARGPCGPRGGRSRGPLGRGWCGRADRRQCAGIPGATEPGGVRLRAGGGDSRARSVGCPAGLIPDHGFRHPPRADVWPDRPAAQGGPAAGPAPEPLAVQHRNPTSLGDRQSILPKIEQWNARIPK